MKIPKHYDEYDLLHDPEPLDFHTDEDIENLFMNSYEERLFLKQLQTDEESYDE